MLKGVLKAMWKWKKIGRIYNPTEYQNRPSWQWAYAQGQNILLFDDFIRVYICCREEPNESGQTKSRIGYVDLDRQNLFNIIRISEIPILPLGKLGCFDEFGQYPFCAVRKEDLIYGYHGGITRCESVPFNAAIGLAISYDNGNTFCKMGDGPILSYSIDEPLCIGSPKVRIFNSKWYMIYSAGVQWKQGVNQAEVCYKLRMATSDDGINWSKCNYNLLENCLGEDESQACGDVIYKNGIYHMFFCYRKNDNFRRCKTNSYRIGYARSKNMYQWQRLDNLAGIEVSTSGWDSEMIAYPNVFELNEKIYMLYLGNQVGKYGFGIAELEGELT